MSELTDLPEYREQMTEDLKQPMPGVEVPSINTSGTVELKQPEGEMEPHVFMSLDHCLACAEICGEVAEFYRRQYTRATELAARLGAEKAKYEEAAKLLGKELDSTVGEVGKLDADNHRLTSELAEAKEQRHKSNVCLAAILMLSGSVSTEHDYQLEDVLKAVEGIRKERDTLRAEKSALEGEVERLKIESKNHLMTAHQRGVRWNDANKRITKQVNQLAALEALKRGLKGQFVFGYKTTDEDGQPCERAFVTDESKFEYITGLQKEEPDGWFLRFEIEPLTKDEYFKAQQALAGESK